MNKIALHVGARGGKIYIPRAVNAYLYDASDKKEHIVTLNSHIHLAKACLCQPFVIESYYVKEQSAFIEHGIDSGGFDCVLKGEGEVTASMTAIRGPVPDDVHTPVWRPIYIPIKSHHESCPALPEGALVQVRNVNSLANAFATLYALKSADEIMNFARRLNRNLN